MAALTPVTSITVIVSPYHVGAYGEAVGAGPLAIIDHGLIRTLRGIGVKIHVLELSNVNEAEGEIGKSFELLRRTSKAVTEAAENGSFPIVLAGNCSSEVGVLSGVSASTAWKSAERTPGCIWFDAHDDYNTPDVLTSGYFDSMGVAMLGGECWKTLLKSIPGYRPINLKDTFVHCGMRDVTELERSRVEAAGFDVIWGSTKEKVDFTHELQSTLCEKKMSHAVVHVDLDNLDTSVARVNKFSAPGGLLAEDLLGCLKAIPAHTRPLSLTVASYDPAFDPEGEIPPIATECVVAFIQSMISRDYITTRG